MAKAGIVSLGCSKNLVDSELTLGCLASAGIEITTDEGEADVVIVNTCGFITPAKEESIDAIFEAAQKKKPGAKLVVMGCLSQRYMSELKVEMPEVDLFWGVGRHGELAERICALLGFTGCGIREERVLSTPPYRAYLRIADGCDNRCAYCAIPLIRGGRRSTDIDSLLREAEGLAKRGVKELTLIAQDTSAYGSDIYGRPMLSTLLSRLAEEGLFQWLRVLYAYPNTVTEELVDTMLSHESIVKYIDMPIQHIAPDMLRRMNRHGTAEHIKYITDYIRAASSEFILRTTVMLGFPGETEEEFGQLAEFLMEHPFDRVGAFTYSQEDNTPAADMPDQLPEEVKASRLDTIMRAQQGISLEFNKRRVGKTYKTLVESVGAVGKGAGRTYGEAPDVDGLVAVSGLNNDVKPGDFINVEVTRADIYDLEGVALR